MMNAMTEIVPEAVGLSLPADISFGDWEHLGKSLFNQRRNTDWMLADWWNFGKDHFQDNPQFLFMVEQVAADPKRLSSMGKVAAAFPSHMRAGNVSFEVHKEIAAVDPEHRLKMINEAAKQRWTERTAHQKVVEHRYKQGSFLPEDDPENREAVEMIRAWNRGSPDARRYFFELASVRNFGCINEDEVIDA